MYMPKLRHVLATTYRLAFPLFQEDSPGDLYVGGIEAGDFQAFSRNSYQTSTFTARGNVVVSSVGLIAGLFSAAVTDVMTGNEEHFIVGKDQTNPKAFRDLIIRVQTFGAELDDIVTIPQKRDLTNPSHDIAAIGGDPFRLDGFGAVAETWIQGTVSGVPTTTQFDTVLINLPDALVRPFRGRTLAFLDGKGAQVQTIVQDYDGATLTFKKIQVAPESLATYIII